MQLYFFMTDDVNWESANNWYEDDLHNTPHGSIPAGGDDVSNAQFDSTQVQVNSYISPNSCNISLGVYSGGTLGSGTFNAAVVINSGGQIQGGTFYGNVENGGSISAGDFIAAFINDSSGNVNGAIFENQVTNNGTMSNVHLLVSSSLDNEGTFSSGLVDSYTVSNGSTGIIYDGTFSGPISGSGTINGGTFTGALSYGGSINGGTFNNSGVDYDNYGSINAGTFTCNVFNHNSGVIYGGTFHVASLNVKNYSAVVNGDFTVAGNYVSDSGTSTQGGMFKVSGTISSFGSITFGVFFGSILNFYGNVYGGLFMSGSVPSFSGTLGGYVITTGRYYLDGVLQFRVTPTTAPNNMRLLKFTDFEILASGLL